MADVSLRPASPAAARTRLLLEGPIVPTFLRIAAPNPVVNVVLISVTASSSVASSPAKSSSQACSASPS